MRPWREKTPNRILGFTIWLLLLTATSASAESSYVLDWANLDQDSEKQIVSSSSQVEPPRPTERKSTHSTPRPVPSKQPAETFQISVLANQDFDYYRDRYRKVSRVESVVYRGSAYPEDTVHCNRAFYESFEVILDDLSPGDRIEVRVTWDDGSHRTIHQTISESSERRFYIDEPLDFDAAFSS